MFQLFNRLGMAHKCDRDGRTDRTAFSKQRGLTMCPSVLKWGHWWKKFTLSFPTCMTNPTSTENQLPQTLPTE